MSGIAKHGVIRVNTLKVSHARKHLAAMVASASEVQSYGGHSVTGQASGGSFASGGASGSDYQTTSDGTTGDADSSGT